jgi:hypothetical protein
MLLSQWRTQLLPQVFPLLARPREPISSVPSSRLLSPTIGKTLETKERPSGMRVEVTFIAAEPSGHRLTSTVEKLLDYSEKLLISTDQEWERQ